MTLYQAEYRSRIRREKTKEAITMAMENRWEEAVAVNRSIVEMFPDDVEAHNRLGKALSELGRYEEARAAFARTLDFSPSNAIAKKNLERLSLLAKEQQPTRRGQKLLPEQFLEESGKSGTCSLAGLASRQVLAKVAAGDLVILRIADHKLVVESTGGDCLGQIPPRLAARLIRLMQGGNRYEAAVARMSGSEVKVIIREVYQDPSQARVTSFPSRGEQSRLYAQGTILESDLLEQEDENVESAPSYEWGESGEGEEEAFVRPGFSEERSMDDEEEEES